MRCTKADHEALKLDDSRWHAIRLDGVQHVEAFDGEPAYSLEVRTCSCGSTLARRITKPTQL